jgi:hypothetical protein
MSAASAPVRRRRRCRGKRGRGLKERVDDARIELRSALRRISAAASPIGIASR